MKTLSAFKLNWLIIILTLGLQISACAPTESKRTESVSATSDGSGEYLATFDVSGQCAAYSLKFDQGQVRATLYYFFHCSALNMYAEAYTRKKIGTYTFDGVNYVISWAYETCGKLGGETVLRVDANRVSASVNGVQMEIKRTGDDYAQWLGQVGLPASYTEDRDCNSIP